MNRDDIIRMARTVRDGGHWNQLDIVNFGLLVAAHERDECARVCDEWSKREDDVGGYIGRAIRARGEV